MSRSHGLLRLSEKIFNTPQFMTQETFQNLTSYIVDRNTGSLAWQVNIDEQTKEAKSKSEEEGEGKILALNPLKANSFKRPDFSSVPEEDREKAYQQYLDFIQYDPAMKLGVLNVEGTTVYRSTPFEAMCGMTSYQRLERTLKAQLAEGAKTVLMYVDSGGGEAYGMIETASNLRTLADEAGAKIVAYVDGVSGSAAYGLTAVAHEVIANPSSRVGSIGVVVSLMNNSKQLEKDGLERIYLYKGDNKVALDKDGNFSESFLKTVDEMITESYQHFTSHVANFRGIPVQSVIDTQASVYTAQKALEVGLVDRLMGRSEFFSEYLVQVVGGANSNNNLYKMVAKTIPTNEVNTKMDIEDIKNQATAPEAAVEDVVEQADAGTVVEEAKTDTDTSKILSELNVNLSMDTTELEKFTAEFAEMQEVLASKEELIQQLTSEKEHAVQALEDFKHAALVANRKEQLSTVLAADKVDANLKFAEKLSEDDFKSYMQTLESVYTASKASIAEIGVKAEDTEATQTFDDILKATIEKANAVRA